MLIIDRLINCIEQKASPIVVGLDPVLEGIPPFIRQEAESRFGNTLQGVSEAFYSFNRDLIEALHPLIPAVKLQMACYELYGQWGVEVFERTVELARSLGLIVIDDAKRNDIGSTARLYAVGHLGKAPLFKGESLAVKADFLTVNPYLGEDSITPFIEECLRNNRGLFILARTSNRSAHQYQEAVVDKMPLYQKIAQDIQAVSVHHCGNFGFSPFGAVVGATWPDEIVALRRDMKNVFFLVPGYGAQGATADHVAHAFNQDGLGAIINSSRGIIYAQQLPVYRERYPRPEQFTKASVAAVTQMRDDLLRSLKQADKLPKNW